MLLAQLWYLWCKIVRVLLQLKSERTLPKYAKAEILFSLCTLAASVHHACVNDGDSSDWTSLGSVKQPHIAHYSARLSVTSAPSSAPAYSVVVIGALGGVIISQGVIGGGGISETPTEACSLRFSTTGLRKASGLSRFSLFAVGEDNIFWNTQ